MYEIENLRDLFICGDAVQEMQKIPDRSIDLIITSPPYNLKNSTGNGLNPGYFLPTYEVIYLIAKSDFKLVEHANSFGDVWEFKQEMKNEHPAPFPVALIERIISSTNAKIILDPFMGSGTTAIAAKKLNRNFIGVEISPEYCEMSKKRLACASQNIQRELLLPL